MQLGRVRAGDGWLWFDRLLLASLGQLFCGIRRSLGLFLIAVFNIITNLSTYCFKLDMSNLYFDLNFYYRLSMIIILFLCLASFNLYFNRNVNLSMQSSGQVWVAKLFNAVLQADYCASEVLITLINSKSIRRVYSSSIRFSSHFFVKCHSHKTYQSHDFNIWPLTWSAHMILDIWPLTWSAHMILTHDLQTLFWDQVIININSTLSLPCHDYIWVSHISRLHNYYIFSSS